MRKILLVNGKKRAGKDFFSDLVCEKDFEKVAFAKKLKDIACSIVNIDYDEMEDLKNDGKSFQIDAYNFEQNFRNALREMYKELRVLNPGIKDIIEKFDPSALSIHAEDRDFDILTIDARLFLQHMNVFKIIFNDDDIWANVAGNTIDGIDHNVIVSDFRFPNEATTIIEKFGKENVTTVKVIGKNLYDHDEYDNHSSERALDDFEFDYHINNTFWDEESLRSQVIGLLKEIND